MKKVSIFVMTLMLSFVSLSAWALDVDDAKAQGLVGETSKGYLAAVTDSPSSEVADLVASINRKRKLMYSNIAKKRDLPLKTVEKLAAKKAFEKTVEGHFIRSTAGEWIKK